MYYTLEKAAEVLGVTSGDLNRLREAGKVRAFRDGSAWKFRKEDIDNHLADVIKARSSDLPGSDDSDLLNDSDEELPTMLADSASFESLATTADKITARDPEEDAIFLDDSTQAFDSDDHRAGSSGISLDGDDDDDLQLDSDISILDDSYEPSSSNVDLGEEDIVLGGSNSGSGLNLAGDSGLTLGSVPGGGSGSGSGISLLQDEEDNPFSLGSDIELENLEEDKLTQMAGEEPSVSSNTNESSNVKDDVDEIFELESLPEEADTDSDNQTYELVADESTDSQPPTETRELNLDDDEDFQLNPLEMADPESDSESSSQVIALDDDSLFQKEDEPATQPDDAVVSADDETPVDGAFGGGFDSFGDMGGADGGFGGDAGLGDMSGDGLAPISDEGGVSSEDVFPPQNNGFIDPIQETQPSATGTCPYTEGKGCVAQPNYSEMAIGFGLVPCLLVLILAGIGVYELVRVIWSWDQPFGLTGSVLETIGGLLKLF